MQRDAAVVRVLPVAARHPGVEQDLLQGRPLSRLLAQTPANQLLALCEEKTKNMNTSLSLNVNIDPNPGPVIGD